MIKRLVSETIELLARHVEHFCQALGQLVCHTNSTSDSAIDDCHRVATVGSFKSSAAKCRQVEGLAACLNCRSQCLELHV